MRLWTGSNRLIARDRHRRARAPVELAAAVTRQPHNKERDSLPDDTRVPGSRLIQKADATNSEVPTVWPGTLAGARGFSAAQSDSTRVCGTRSRTFQATRTQDTGYKRSIAGIALCWPTQNAAAIRGKA